MMNAAADSDAVRAPSLGLRVRHRVDHRTGFVVGSAERIGTRSALVPVIVEASTRSELWPESQLQVLPTAQQHRALGGRYTAPAGYPLHI